jgi:hypothetical protein
MLELSAYGTPLKVSRVQQLRQLSGSARDMALNAVDLLNLTLY